MKNANEFYQVISHCEVNSRDDVFDLISEHVSQDSRFSSKKELVEQLKQRENAGDIQIAEHVLLPHIESPLLKQSQLLFLRLDRPLRTWNEHIENIELIIVVLLKENDELATKKRIRSLMKKLADEAFIIALLSAKNQATFQKELTEI